MKIPVSVIVITYNEEENISKCLDSLQWANEIIIIDSESTDKTIEIAKTFGSRIFIKKDSYSNNRNYGFELAVNEWILWIDADEVISEKLKNELISVISSNNNDIGFLIKRKTYFISKFIKHAGWYPDKKLRLFRKSSGARFENKPVHENIIYDFKPGILKNDILHYTDRTFEHYIDKMNKYTDIQAAELYDKKNKAGLIDIFLKPIAVFIKMYFIKFGLLDGYIGFILCLLSSVSEHVKYSKLYFLNKNNINYGR